MTVKGCRCVADINRELQQAMIHLEIVLPRLSERTVVIGLRCSPRRSLGGQLAVHILRAYQDHFGPEHKAQQLARSNAGIAETSFGSLRGVESVIYPLSLADRGESSFAYSLRLGCSYSLL